MFRKRSRLSARLKLYSKVALCLLLSLFLSASRPAINKRDKISDDQIREAIARKLSFVRNLKVEVQNGKVVLEGSVMSLLARRTAGNEAGRTRGVVKVENRLQVLPPARTDLQIKRDITTALATQAWFPPRNVAVEVHNGVATLTGSVDNIRVKHLIEQLVSGVRGVRDIVNNISVVELEHRASARSDDKVKRDIEFMLVADLGEAAAKNISVEVANGHVTLRGTVKGLCEKVTATQAAESVRGVSQITDLIKVTW